MQEDQNCKISCFSRTIDISKNALVCIKKGDIAGALFWLKKRREVLQKFINTTILEQGEGIREDLEAVLHQDSLIKNEICSQQQFLKKELNKLTIILRERRRYSAGSLPAEPWCIDKKA